MSETISQHGALHSYVDKWLAVQPQQRAALVFVDAARYPRHVALAAWEQELLSAAYRIGEPHVAAAKLHWWAEELNGAPSSGGRHPLTCILFDDERAHAMPKERWLAPVLAAIAHLEEGTAVDFSAQLVAATALHGALATLETAWWYGLTASPARAARVATLNHLLHALGRLRHDLGRDRLPLPMARLARFGLSRDALARPSRARDAAIKAQLDDLRSAWVEAGRCEGPLSVFRALEASESERLAHKAARATEPLKALEAGMPGSAFLATLRAWQAARHWQRRGAC